jgi:hypothetical protein
MHTVRERNAAFWLKLYHEPKRRPKDTSLCSELSNEEHDKVVRILEEIARAMITGEVPISARVVTCSGRAVGSCGFVREVNLRVHIAALRKVLGDGLDGARYISNVADQGYCFVEAVVHSAVERTLPGTTRAVGLGGEIAAARGQAEASLERLRAALEGLHSEQQVVSGHIGHIR